MIVEDDENFDSENEEINIPEHEIASDDGEEMEVIPGPVAPIVDIEEHLISDDEDGEDF